jgi:hypothetical protein
MSERPADANDSALATTDDGRLWLVTNTARKLAKFFARPDAPCFVFRWPEKPYHHAFPDVQTASVWGSQADVYAVANAAGDVLAVGRQDGTDSDGASRSARRARNSGQSAGESHNVRSNVRKQPRGYKKTMSAPEIVTEYLKKHPADVWLGLDALQKKISKAAKKKVGRTTVNEIQRTFRADAKK